jgi:hypothetical protein
VSAAAAGCSSATCPGACQGQTEGRHCPRSHHTCTHTHNTTKVMRVAQPTILLRTLLDDNPGVGHCPATPRARLYCQCCVGLQNNSVAGKKDQVPYLPSCPPPPSPAPHTISGCTSRVNTLTAPSHLVRLSPSSSSTSPMASPPRRAVSSNASFTMFDSSAPAGAQRHDQQGAQRQQHTPLVATQARLCSGATHSITGCWQAAAGKLKKYSTRQPPLCW